MAEMTEPPDVDIGSAKRQGATVRTGEPAARARLTMPWGKKIRGKPGLCRGVWMFAGVP